MTWNCKLLAQKDSAIDLPVSIFIVFIKDGLLQGDGEPKNHYQHIDVYYSYLVR